MVNSQLKFRVFFSEGFLLKKHFHKHLFSFVSFVNNTYWMHHLLKWGGGTIQKMGIDYDRAMQVIILVKWVVLSLCFMRAPRPEQMVRGDLFLRNERKDQTKYHLLIHLMKT